MPMKPLTMYETWYGRDEAPPEVIKLRAGKLELEFEAGDLRYIRFAGREIIRRVYGSVRDLNWNTLPPKMTNLTVNAAEDHFHIQFDAYHEKDALKYRWHGSIEGRPDGVIGYAMDGVAEGDFRYCRIGFCVLHPIAGIAGSPYRAVTPAGAISGVLSELIAPQRMENGIEAPIFPSCSSLAIDSPEGMTIITDFEGDLFEMEDQRNWTDGSFKTYCTPLALGYPHQAKARQRFYQKVIVRVETKQTLDEATEAESGNSLSFSLGDASGHTLPQIGFGMASSGEVLSERETQLLSQLHPDHLKVELHFRASSWLVDLEKAITAAQQLGCPLELAIFLESDSPEPLETLKSRLQDVNVARVIVFHEAEASGGTTSSRWMELAREHLADALPGVPLVGGTNGNFAELNRQPPDISAMDGVSYTLNPQVHAFDGRSLIEGIEVQYDTVMTARSFCGELPICVSSVTLKPPFNQAANEEEAPQNPDELPAPVDQRQMSLFGAAWTVGSLRSLSLGGVDSITYYETTGWRGLLEGANGSPLPEKFRSFPGMIFPVYWVFQFLADARGAQVLRIRSDNPLLVDGLVFRHGNRIGILLANLQPCTQEVHLNSLPAGKATLRRLNQDSIMMAAEYPEEFLKRFQPLPINAGAAVQVFEPYETAFWEIELT